MTRSYRFLSSTNVTESSDRGSEFALILAALICAIVCVVGLTAIAYCTWLQRRLLANQTPSHPSAANKGIEKKLVQAIPKFTYDSAKEEKGGDCVICLVEYADGDEVRVLPQCGHRFHIGCIDEWLGSHSSCPSCRQAVVIGKYKNCCKFPAITVEPEGKQHSGGCSSVIKVEGSY